MSFLNILNEFIPGHTLKAKSTVLSTIEQQLNAAKHSLNTKSNDSFISNTTKPDTQLGSSIRKAVQWGKIYIQKQFQKFQKEGITASLHEEIAVNNSNKLEPWLGDKLSRITGNLKATYIDTPEAVKKLKNTPEGFIHAVLGQSKIKINHWLNQTKNKINMLIASVKLTQTGLTISDRLEHLTGGFKASNTIKNELIPTSSNISEAV